MHIRIANIDEFMKLWDYSNTPTYKYFLEQLTIKNVEFWTIDLSGKLIGELYIFWNSEDNDEANGIDRAYLCAFRVQKNFQGRGYGKALMNTVLERIKDKGFKEVTIGIDNDDFVKLESMYNKLGFTQHIKSTNIDYHYIKNDGNPTTYEESYMLKLKFL